MSVHIERQGAVTTAIIDRPAARNAIDRATAAALARGDARSGADRFREGEGRHGRFRE
ncbi:MAG: hypothetical protein Q8O52_17210 [Sulfuritalea sp.]|nr:hypothetical protein [Sulfuritalea sp.]